jgi:hypothetical protein
MSNRRQAVVIRRIETKLADDWNNFFFWRTKLQAGNRGLSVCTTVDSLSSLLSSGFELSDDKDAEHSSNGSIRSRKGRKVRVVASFGSCKLEGAKIALTQRLRCGTSTAIVGCGEWLVKGQGTSNYGRGTNGGVK